MRHLLKIDGWADIWVNGCELCGHTWISQVDYPAKKCPSRECRTQAWNGESKKKGRKSKLQLHEARFLEDPVNRLILDATGEHHLLCSCLACLGQIKAEQKEREQTLWQMWQEGLEGKRSPERAQQGMMHGHKLGEKLGNKREDTAKRLDTCLAKPGFTTWKKWEKRQLEGALLRYQAQENARRLAPGGINPRTFAPTSAPPSLCQDARALSGQGDPARHGHNPLEIFFAQNFL